MKIAIYNPVGWIKRNNSDSIDTKYRDVGNNTGNLVYANALIDQLDNASDTWFGLEENKEEIRAGVIPSSNALNIKGNTLESQAQCIKECSYPVTLVGLGAQATPEFNTPSRLVKELPSSCVDAIRLIAQQTVSIGVRGYFTAECLEKLGIHNYRVIGCPSLYFCKKKIKKVNTPENIRKTVFNVTHKGKFQNCIVELGIKNNSYWIMQQMGELARTLLENKKISESDIEYLFPGLKISTNSLESFIKKNAKIFFDMEQWYDYLNKEKFDFSYGSRFHGNVAALRSGIPTLWITHDSRTQELVDLFGLPYMPIEAIPKVRFLGELVEKCDYTQFYKNYDYLRNEYIAFLNENFLDNKFEY
ncbi:hypothetical protein C0033_08580 [Clostridium sp. chh4-2]|uniref:polysaccharide pyruvyl transferase family protein n=1 Tax=Clostridium sp. chh4-2 TaxID=2067550 RepID=UPI000CCE5431|nr:polysaccharide pyruvyl transferase family protein [Clostridium sp. chh4-2]PNV62603.1 hypothetical protein C0033_08580 [Clostridium sp. chh4-2]